MKMDPLAGLATPTVPGKKKKAMPAMPTVKKPMPAQKAQGATKPVPQNFSAIRNARS
jgi:hypothetical protein